MDNANKGSSCKGREISRRDFILVITVVVWFIIIESRMLLANIPMLVQW